MKNIITIIFCFIAVFYVEYEAYDWNPCNDDGMCLAIACPPEGCRNPSKHFFVESLSEVREIVENHGTEHLYGMWQIEFDTDGKNAKVTPLKLVPSFQIEKE